MDVSFIMRHPRPDSIRLKRLQKYFLYAVLALLFLSGVAWAYLDYLTSSPGEFGTSAKALGMKIQGAGGRAFLGVFGMLLGGDGKFARRPRRDLAQGSGLLMGLV